MKLSYEDGCDAARCVGDSAYALIKDYPYLARARFLLWKNMHEQMLGTKKGGSKKYRNYHLGMLKNAKIMMELVNKQIEREKEEN